MSYGFFMMSAAGRGGVSALWTPAHLAITPEICLDWDSSVTDVAGYASEWSNSNGSIGGGFAQSVPDQRPEIIPTELNGNRVFRFDGANDWLRMESVAAGGIFRAAGVGWSFSLVKKRGTDTSGGTRIIFYAPNGPNSSVRFATTVGRATGHNRNWLVCVRLDGTAVGGLDGSPSPGSWIARRDVMRWSAGEGSIHINGALDAFNGSLTSSGATSDTSGHNNRLTIGADAVSSVPASYGDIDLAVLLAGADASEPSEAEWQRLEGYYLHGAGLQSNLQGDHPFRYVPPFVNTPVLQPSFASDPVVFGFVAATNSGDVGVAAGDAVASEFGTLLNSDPALGTGEGIEVLSDGSTIAVTLTGLAPPATPAQAVVMDHKGNAIATIALTGSGPYTGTGGGELVDGDVYYVRIEA